VNLVSTLVRQLKEIKKSATAKVRSAMVIKNHRQVQDQAASPQVVNMVVSFIFLFASLSIKATKIA